MPITEHLLALRRSNTHTLGIWFLGSKNKTLHLAFPMSQKLFNLIKEWGIYEVFSVKGFNVW
jgi:hypothetical protein